MKLRFLIPLMIVLCSCTFGLTRPQQVLWGLEIYYSEYDKYLEATINPALTQEQKDILKADPKLITLEYTNPNLSEETRKVLRVKWDLLNELKPLVEIVGEYHITGKLPTAEVQNKLNELISKLIALSED